MCHLALGSLGIEGTNKTVEVPDMSKSISCPGLGEYGIRTSRITATGGGIAPNTSPVVAHVKGLLW